MEKILFLDDTNKPVFPETGQEQALAESEVLRLYGRNRQEMRKSRWYPKYHYVSPVGFLHDPNGLCFWKGLWHLFCQHTYTDTAAIGVPEGRSVCWGHVVSEDLIHWRDLPDAIYPNPEQACWSGATLVGEDRVIAAYYGLNTGIMVAVSHDPLLLNWEKVGHNRVAIPHKNEDGTEAPCPVFDPCLFRRGEFYYLLSSPREYDPLRKRPHRQQFLFRSKDLIHWEYRHPFIENDVVGAKDDDGACPYFMDIGTGEDKKQLVVHFSHLDGAKFMLGHYDEQREKFCVMSGEKFSSGHWMPGGLHAPSAYPDGKGGAVVLFNMNNSAEGSDPIMSLPQQMHLSGSVMDEIDLDVVESVYSLRGAHTQVPPRKLPAGELWIPEQLHGDCIELHLRAQVPYQRALELYVLRAPDEEEYVKITVFRNCGIVNQDLCDVYKVFDYSQNTVVTVDSTHASRASHTAVRPPEICEVPLWKEDPVELDVFLDRGMLEVFINKKRSILQRVFPEREDSVGIALRAVGGDTELLCLEQWEMDSIE